MERVMGIVATHPGKKNLTPKQAKTVAKTWRRVQGHALVIDHASVAA